MNFIKKIPFFSAHFHTLRQRVILILSVCVLICFALVAIVSHVTISAMKKDGLETTLKTDVTQLNDIMDNDYDTLVELSQQMSVEGSVGKQVNNYLLLHDHYERIESSYNVNSEITDLTFSHTNLSLIGYVCDEPNIFPNAWEQTAYRTIFFNLPLKSNLRMGGAKTLMRTSALQLQAMHRSFNYSSDRYAISLLRNVSFADNNVYYIYEELFSSVPSKLQSLSTIRNLPYSFVQTDCNGNICYSSSSTFKIDSRLATPHLEGDMKIRRESKYVYIAARSTFGFYNVLLVPESIYSQQDSLWKMRITGIFLMSLLLIVSTGFLLFHMIYHPLQALGHDMIEVGKGNFVSA